MNNAQAMRGVDISRYNHPVDYKGLYDAGVRFVIINCDGKNVNYSEQVKGCRDAGLKIGIYDYYYGGDGVVAANRFIDRISDQIGEAILCLDYEERGLRNDAEANRWLRRVDEVTDVPPLIYTYPSWEPSIDMDYDRWLAQWLYKRGTGVEYQSIEDFISERVDFYPNCQGTLAIYQWTNSWYINGKKFDGNIAYMTPAGWDAYAAGRRVTQTPFPDPPSSDPRGLLLDEIKTLADKVKGML